MPTVTRFPTSNSAVSGTWTGVTNAYAANGSVASNTISSKNTTNDHSYGGFGFHSVIPAGATINSVTVNVRHRNTTTAGIAFLENLLLIGATQGQVNTNDTEPTSLTIENFANYPRPGGGSWTRDDLSDANLTARIRNRSGNSATSFSSEWDYISITVDYSEADTVPPTATTFIPANGAANVSPSTNIIIGFDEPIARGTGTIEIRNGSAAGTLIESFNAATSNRISINGSSVTIDPIANLAELANVFVVIPAGAFQDIAGNAYAGTSAYNFTTGDFSAPTVTAFTPANGATEVGLTTNIVITFSENIARGTGTITLRTGSASGTIVESYNAATSDRISIDGGTFTLDPTADLSPATVYFLVIPSGAIRDTSTNANAYSGTSTYSFTSANVLAFPANPTLNMSYTFNSRKWRYNGVGWERPLVSKLGDTIEGNLAVTGTALIQPASGNGTVTVRPAAGASYASIQLDGTSAAEGLNLSGGQGIGIYSALSHSFRGMDGTIYANLDNTGGTLGAQGSAIVSWNALGMTVSGATVANGFFINSGGTGAARFQNEVTTGPHPSASGVGLEMGRSAGGATSYIVSYNRTAMADSPLLLGGSEVRLQAGGAVRATVTSTGLSMSGIFSIGGESVAYNSGSGVNFLYGGSAVLRFVNQAGNSTWGEWSNGHLGVVGTLTSNGLLQTGSAFARFEGTGGSGVGATGAGINIYRVGSTGVVEAFDYTANALCSINIRGNIFNGRANIYQFANTDGSNATQVEFKANNLYFDGIGTTASAANAFINSANFGQVLRSTSSIRYKTDIEDLDPQYAYAALDLRPVWYRSLAEADPSAWSYYGLIAEEVAEIEPRLVHWNYTDDDYEDVTVEYEELETEEVEEEDEDGNPTTRLVEKTVTKERTEKRLKADAEKVPDGVQYERLSVLLLDIVKRQDARITELENRLNALDGG
jgi:hypothetical protein